MLLCHSSEDELHIGMGVVLLKSFLSYLILINHTYIKTSEFKLARWYRRRTKLLSKIRCRNKSVLLSQTYFSNVWLLTHVLKCVMVLKFCSGQYAACWLVDIDLYNIQNIELRTLIISGIS